MNGTVCVGHTNTLSLFTTVAAMSLASAALGQTCQWTQLASGTFPIRFDSVIVFDEARDEMLLWGGSLIDFKTWAWDGNEWVQVSFGFPSARQDHAMVYDSFRERVVMFGGRDGPTLTLNDTWEWDGSSWSEITRIGPSPLYGLAMAYDRKRKVTVLYGGRDVYLGPQHVVDDTWEWDGTSWKHVSFSGPSGRSGHAMSYDEAREVIVMHGGVDRNETIRNDTWEWDGITWTFKASNGPRTLKHTMTYVPSLGKCVLFDSFNSPTGDLWAWDGSDWELLSSEASMDKPFARIAADRTRDTIMLFDDRGSGDTWEWTCEAACYADCDQSTGVGFLDVFDFLCFQDGFVSSEPYACDCDTSTGLGVCDVFDFLCFQNDFVGGCP